jgi:integrase
MRSDWNRYIDLCYQQGAAIFPPQMDTIRLFLEKESKERKFSSIRRYSITLSSIYRLLGQPDPLRNTHVRLLLLELRLDKKGDQKQSDALTSAHLNMIHKKLHLSEELLEIRDLAIYFVMFECALKRAELRDMKKQQISFSDETRSQISINEFSYQLSAKATEALKNWLRLVNDNSVYVFRAVDKHNNISVNKLNDSSIYRVFQKAALLLGQPHLKFSGQSARIGAVKELHQQGEKIAEIQQFGRWNSPVMPTQYVGNKSQSEQLQLRFKKFKPWN